MSVLANELARSSIADRLTHVDRPGGDDDLARDARLLGLGLSGDAPEDLRALDAPTPLAAWPGVSRLGRGDGGRSCRTASGRSARCPPTTPATRAFLTRCCEILIASEADLNALDAKSGDGDTGSTLASAARAILASMDRLPLADHTQLYRAIGQELGQTVGGSSGVLLAIFFAAAGDAASSGLTMRDSLAAGLARMQEIGGAKLGDRTMVDALQPALERLDEGLAKAAEAARRGADRTADDPPREGRARVLPERRAAEGTRRSRRRSGGAALRTPQQRRRGRIVVLGVRMPCGTHP